jgi:dTDP-4-dehydrorhamnose 3,5-epimerase
MDEVIVYENSSFKDERGELWTIWEKSKFTPNLIFNHDKVAKSKKNVLRGLHGDSKSWKLITCLYGEIFLSVVDYRESSPTYLKHINFILNDVNKKTVLVPPMFANGHLVLSDECVFYYKWAYEGDYPDVDEQFSLRWDDPKLNIEWPTQTPILSDRDKNSKFL